MGESGSGASKTATGTAVTVALLLLPGLGQAQPSRHFRFRIAEDSQEVTLDGRTRAQMALAEVGGGDTYWGHNGRLFIDMKVTATGNA